MKKQDLINTRQALWRRLEKYLDRLEATSASKLQQHELEEFVHLYRIACSDLARARSEDLGDDVEGYVNMLVARGYKQFHPPRPPKLKNVVRFFLRDFPRAVRHQGTFFMAASLLFVIPVVLSAFIVMENPANAYVLTSPETLEALTHAYAEGHSEGRSESQDTAMAGYYVNNNIGIAFRCFATGIFFGLGSIFFLITNGVLGGTTGAYIFSAGYGENFLAFIVGHSSLELTAIVLAGATGLRLGMMLVNPGRFTRLDALKHGSQDMIRVILGATVMLFLAAFVEGFWSPSAAAPIVKFVVGSILWVVVITYLVFAGRTEPAGEGVKPVHEVHK